MLWRKILSNVIEGDCVHEAVYLARLKKISMEYYSTIRWNTSTCNYTDRSWEYHPKQSQSDKGKKKEPYDCAHMWNIKQKMNETNKKQKQK